MSTVKSLSTDTAGASAGAVRRQRILLVVDGVYPSTGGCEMQVRLVSRSFAAAGHDVTVLAPHLNPQHAFKEVFEGVPVERIAYPKIRRIGAMLLCLRFALILLWRRNRYDAIHVHTAQNLGAVAGMLKPFLPSTLMIKISGAWEFQGGVLDPKGKKKLYNRFLNAGLQRADGIQCISEFTRQMLLDAGYDPQRLKMIPNAVDLQRFAPVEPAGGAPRIAYVGRLVPVKALPVLLDAFALLAGSTDARLTIAGDGPQRAELEQQAARLGIAARVDFLGNVSDVPKALAPACVYVQPSYQEGMPNSVLEAMACGLPVVASRVSGNEDLVTDGENGLLVPAGDAPALAAALRSLLEDAPRAQRMGRASRGVVERLYSVPAVLNQLLTFYERPRS